MVVDVGFEKAQDMVRCGGVGLEGRVAGGGGLVRHAVDERTEVLRFLEQKRGVGALSGK